MKTYTPTKTKMCITYNILTDPGVAYWYVIHGGSTSVRLRFLANAKAPRN